MKIRFQSGFTLIEVSVVLLLMGILFGGITPTVKNWLDTRKAVNDSGFTKAIGEAANAYVKDNYSAIMAVATPTQPAIITVPMLIGSNYLTAGTSTNNLYNQNICVLVKEPTAGNLQALLVTEGGDTLDDIDVGFYAAGLGGSGGFVRSTSATVINGVGGSWSINTSTFDNLVNDAGTRCDGSAGNVRIQPGHSVMALWFSSEDNNTSGTLYRDSVPSRPELNRMNTAIDMNSNNIDNANAVNASNISATTDIQAPVFIDSDNPTFRVDASGISTMNRIDASTVYDRDDNGFFIDPNGTSRLNVVRPDFIEPQTTVTEGTACAPNGRISKDSTGKILSCQSGSWASASDGGSLSVEITNIAGNGPLSTATAVCERMGSGWGLPTISQLIRAKELNPALSSDGNIYRTSSPSLNGPGDGATRFWVYRFSDNGIWSTDVNGGYYFRCSRLVLN